MDVADFDFELPEASIAQAAVEPRDAARLLVYERAADRVRHVRVRDLDRVLAAGDLLVVNDTRVLPHRLLGRRSGGGRLEVLLLERDGDRARGFVRPAARLRAGARLPLEGGALELEPLEREDGGIWRVRLHVAPGEDLEAVLERVGRAPLPPYIRRDDDAPAAPDRERYQTVFAARPGAVAAPTAGLHFTPELLDRLAAAGVERASVTLHVGEGTFAPVRVDRIEEHVMHAESYELPPATAAAVARARERGGRVVAVGTTSVRTLETCRAPERRVAAGVGASSLFLYPGQGPQVVDALLTNFHLPRSTLVMLVASMVGRERLLELYAEAIAEGYRFYSYGDAMLIL